MEYTVYGDGNDVGERMEWMGDDGEGTRREHELQEPKEELRLTRRFARNGKGSRVSMVRGDGGVFAPGSRFFLLWYKGWPSPPEGLDVECWEDVLKELLPVGTKYFGCFVERGRDDNGGVRSRVVLVMVDFGCVRNRCRVEMGGKGFSLYDVVPVVGAVGKTGVWMEVDEAERSINKSVWFWQKRVEDWCSDQVGMFGERLLEVCAKGV